MNRPNVITIFLVVNLITLGFIIGLINFTFQQATLQRDQSTSLVEEFHKSDSASANRTLDDISRHVTQDTLIHARQIEIVTNQLKILKSIDALNKTVASLANQKIMMKGLNKIQNATTVLDEWNETHYNATLSLHPK